MWTRVLYACCALLLLSPALGGRGGGGGRGSGGSRGGWGGGHSGGSHTYPTHHGLSGTGAGHPNTHNQNPSYPYSPGLSGNSVPKGTVQNNHVSNNQHHHTTNTHNQKTEIHNHYYSPPQQIHYPSYSSASLPVYHGAPPTYVYHYRDSGSRYNNLLTGLALYNLGRMSSHHNNYGSYNSYNTPYRSTSGEVCKLGVKKDNGDYEESRVDCQIMSSFIYEAQSVPQQQQPSQTQSVSTTITNTTTVNVNNAVNGSANGNSSVTVQTTVVEALEQKGPPIAVTPRMQCYMIRTVPYSSTMRKEVPCGLLQTYADSSMRRTYGSGSVAKVDRLMGFVLSMSILFWHFL